MTDGLKLQEAGLENREYEYIKLAIKLYDSAIKLNPNLAEAYKNRGKCYEALGRHEESQADFKKAKALRKKG